MKTDLRAHLKAPPTVLPTPWLTQAHCGSADPGASAAGGTSAAAVSMTVQSGCAREWLQRSAPADREAQDRCARTCLTY